LKNQKLTYAVLAALGANVGVAVAADTDTGGIDEIVVTAQRRNESLQNVPITIQAVTGEQLKELGVVNFEDLLRFTPNVTYSGNGAGGTGNIFMRGLSSGGSGNQSQSTTAPFPNVALYLDDQSMQFPARNNDVYLVDMERVEVLEGPQGTLFGGGAQAGAVRYITNKPKLDVTEGNVNAGYGITAGGGPNSMLNATINLPLIADTLAVRATIFNEQRGGYINNVPGTICNVIQTSVCANNGALVADDTNTMTYQGFRLSALWKFNDDWSLLLQQNYQNSQADGYWGETPNGVNGQLVPAFNTAGTGIAGTPLPQNSIQAFTPAYDKDKYESTAWTLNGKIGSTKVVYTGSYMTRNIDQQADYSNYMRSYTGSYYTCTGTLSKSGYFHTKGETTGNCYAPVGDWNDNVKNTHQTHEIRFSTDDEARFRVLGGAFWEAFDIYDQMNFNYLPIPQCGAAGSANLTAAQNGGPDCLSAVGPIPGFPASSPGLRLGTGSAFGEDVHRGYKQTALFGSADFDIIPKTLTLTAGTRYFHYDEFEEGSEYYSETTSPLIVNHPDGACTAGAFYATATGPCGFGINLHKKENGFRSRINLTWHIDTDMMAYYTFSQGFRPGGFNRTASDYSGNIRLRSEIPYYASTDPVLAACAAASPTGKCKNASQQYYKPEGFNSDNLINNEIGFKGEFLNHRLQVNLSAYLMHWQDIQLPLFSPPVFGNTTFTVNGPSYDVKGVELQLIAKVTDGLTLQGSASWNSSKQTNAPCLESNVPASVGTSATSVGNPTPIGQCITTQKGGTLPNAFGALGTSPAFSPSAEFNLRARYDWNVGDFKPFASIGANHIGSERNEPASFTDGNTEVVPTTTLLLYTMPGYTTYDGSVGVSKDNWTVQVQGSNLLNNDSSTNTTSGQFIKTEYPLRPRVLMLNFGYKF
jgi:outer membrane receptor protein involved in Fe transport